VKRQFVPMEDCGVDECASVPLCTPVTLTRPPRSIDAVK
jgi:hypothetical protein